VPSTPPAPPGTPLIKKDIFRPAPPTPLRAVVDAFAADGAVSLAAEEGAQNMHLPDLFQSVAGPVADKFKATVKVAAPAPSRVGEWVKKVGAVKWRSVVCWVGGERVKGWVEVWDRWWMGERKGRVVDGYLPNRELDALVIEGELSRRLALPISSNLVIEQFCRILFVRR
jgi:nucleoporin NDC1